MITEKINMEGIKKKIESVKTKIDNKYNDYNRLLNTCIVKETIIRDKIHKKGKSADTIIQLKDILKTKSGIIMDLIGLIDKRDNYVLMCDNMMYDNVIMYDKICNNIKIISEIN